MPCYHPITAYQAGVGAQVKFRLSRKSTRHLAIPCGQCIGCRLESSRQWATRCMHEAQLSQHNECVLLTYADEHLPAAYSLDHRDFQLFMKRLRKKNPDVRYYMAGEYGEENQRPHYHAALFNLQLQDKTYFYTTKTGTKIYKSEKLQKLWPQGYASTSELTYEAAAYIARYLLQKQTGKNAKAAYETLDPQTGEITKRTPEYNKMSLRPAIGKRWIQRYYDEVYPEGKVFARGQLTDAPRYYNNLFRLIEPSAYDLLKKQRAQQAEEKYHDNTRQRLEAKEAVATARVKLQPRNKA